MSIKVNIKNIGTAPLPSYQTALAAGADIYANNLEKFIALPRWSDGERELEKGEWDCDLGNSWPAEVVKILVLKVGGEYFAVGKDARGKVRKPSSHKSVDLSVLVANS